jgi:hypothetical protein
MNGQKTGRIVISPEELSDTKIDETLELQRASVAGAIQPSMPETKSARRLILANWFYLMLAGALGAFLAWASIEPFFSDGIVFTGKVESVEPDASDSFVSPPAGISIQGRVTVSGVTVWRVVPGTSIFESAKPPKRLQLEDLKPGDIVKVMAEPVMSGSLLIADAMRVDPPGTPSDLTVSVSDLETRQKVVAFLLFPLVAGLVGLLIGAAEGIICRTFARAAWCGGIGLLTGLIAGAISIILGGIVYSIVGTLGGGMGPNATAGAFLLQMFRRGLAWTLAGMGMGLGQGFALKSGKLKLNGFIGGMVGGLIGGLLFDPISLLLSKPELIQGAGLSRAVGIIIVGATVGLMIGLTDLLTRDAWLKVITGPLRGKEFSFNRTPIQLGSSPKSDIYLFKDAKIDPTHAVINKLRDTYEISDQSSATGVFVNGRRIVKSQRLTDGDLIQIGESQFRYSTSESKAA